MSLELYIKSPNTYPTETASSEVTGVRCLKDNNEYLSNPSGNYFPASLDDLDIEFKYENLVENGNTTFKYLYSTEGSIFSTPFSYLIFKSQQVGFLIKTSLGSESISYDFGTSIPTSGKIRVLGVTSGLELYFNDVLVASGSTTNQDITSFASKIIRFNSAGSGFRAYMDITYNSIKFNGNEWISNAWASPITTSSLGTITTLNSDVSTSAMIQGGSSVTPINSKQRYDVTVQK